MEPYPFIQALEELDFSIQGIHLGLQFHLAHVSRIHILKESRDPLTSPFFTPRQGSPRNWHPSTNTETSELPPGNGVKTQRAGTRLSPRTHCELWNSSVPHPKWNPVTASVSQRGGLGGSAISHVGVIRPSEPRTATALCQGQAELKGKPAVPLKACPVSQA